jgi:hypothetical protein
MATVAINGPGWKGTMADGVLSVVLKRKHYEIDSGAKAFIDKLEGARCQSHRRIGDLCSVGLREARHRCRRQLSSAHDVLNVDATNKQRVGDKRAMAPPEDSLGAHDDGDALCKPVQ